MYGTKRTKNALKFYVINIAAEIVYVSLHDLYSIVVVLPVYDEASSLRPSFCLSLS